ncbi:hypothetical protein [Acinetobacter brisouii]|uniref:hypothetical protein n=1 Tax=Acinetobacter brisouii TaxID=396323 RepID=UPI0035B391D4
MEILHLDEKKVNETRQYWIDCAAEQVGESDEAIELDEQFFDFLVQNQSFGDYALRDNLNTYVGVDINGDGNADVLVDIVHHRRGRVKTIKIMDFYYSPAIEQLPDTEYDKQVVDILGFVVNEFIQTTSTVRDGVTKIYSRTDLSLQIMNKLHENIQAYQSEFAELGLNVKLEGKRWLAFRTI